MDVSLIEIMAVSRIKGIATRCTDNAIAEALLMPKEKVTYILDNYAEQVNLYDKDKITIQTKKIDPDGNIASMREYLENDDIWNEPWDD